MEQCIRIAVWMFLLTGQLQAMSISKRSSPQCVFNKTELDFDLLNEEVSCGNHVTFTAPTTMKGECLIEALKVFKDSLEQAQNNCQDDNKRIPEVLSVMNLDNCLPKLTTQTNCSMNETDMQFDRFVSATERFVEQFNNHQSENQ